MTLEQSIILVVAILLIAGTVSYFVQMGQPPLKDFLETKQEVEPLIEERETIVKGRNVQSPKEVEASVKHLLENTSQDLGKVVESVKVFSETAAINVEAAAAPKKKRGHNYNRKPKVQA